MYCEMCGELNEDNAKRCKKCGFSFTGDDDNIISSNAEENVGTNANIIISEDSHYNPVKAAEKKKINIKPYVITGIVAIVLIIGFFIFNIVTKKTGFVKEGEYYVYYRDEYQIKNSYIEENGATYRVDDNGYRLENQVFSDNGKKYYFENDGKMAKRKWINNKFYTNDGSMLINGWSDDGKRVDENGDILLSPVEQIKKSDMRFGSEIRFGEYEQDGNDDNGLELIDWILLYGDNQKAYLLSKNILFSGAYQSSERVETDMGLTYDKSLIKEQLNTFFQEKAFQNNDKKYLVNDSSLGSVYIPSKRDMDEFLPLGLLRCAVPTEIAKESLKNSQTFTASGIYWLRDDSKNNMHKMFVSDVGDIIDDDVSDQIVISNQTYTEMEKRYVGQKEVVVDNGNNNGKEDLGKKYGKSIASGLVSMIVGEIPIVGSLFSGLAGDLVGQMFDDASEENNSSKTVTYEDVYDYVPVLKEKIVQSSLPNPYRDVGFITNQFNGIRPMITIDMSK